MRNDASTHTAVRVFRCSVFSASAGYSASEFIRHHALPVTGFSPDKEHSLVEKRVCLQQLTERHLRIYGIDIPPLISIVCPVM